MDAQTRTAERVSKPRRFEDLYIFGTGKQIIIDSRPTLSAIQIPLCVITQTNQDNFLAYVRTAQDGAQAYAGGRDEMLAVLRDIDVKNGERLLNESFGKEKQTKCAK